MYVLSALSQQIWIVACKNRPGVLYKQAKVALDSYGTQAAAHLIDVEFSDTHRIPLLIGKKL